jgi:hypothetical protein
LIDIALDKIKAMNKKTAFTAVQKSLRKMVRLMVFSRINVMLASDNFWEVNE